ncbi:MAG: metallophosphoesterase family protein [Clostridia bacterium]|nr:metallophosphoesterase family protein [Clostridia bacterium]
MRTFFISDLHFGHKNAIDYDRRPFSSVEEMNEEIIRRWNAKVHADDLVYILGDFTIEDDAVKYASRLKGRKILIRGNHDLYLRKEQNRAIFEKISGLEELNVDGKWLTLCHYPMIEWHGSRRQPSDKTYGYLIYGHIHNNVKELYRRVLTAPNALNASADVNGFVPVTFDELILNNAAYQKRAQAILPTLPEGGEGQVCFADMTLAEAPFEAIRQGEKTVEMRLFDDKRRRLQVGDVIRFRSQNGKDLLFAEVTSLRTFAVFRLAFAEDALRFAAGFRSQNAEEAANAMRAYYSAEEESMLGVLAIGIRLL